MALIPSESYSFPDHFSPVASERKKASKARASANRIQILPPPPKPREEVKPVPQPPITKPREELRPIPPAPQTPPVQQVLPITPNRTESQPTKPVQVRRPPPPPPVLNRAKSVFPAVLPINKVRAMGVKRILPPEPIGSKSPGLPAPDVDLLRRAAENEKAIASKPVPVMHPSVPMTPIQAPEMDEIQTERADVALPEDLQIDLFSADVSVPAKRKWRRQLRQLIVWETCVFGWLVPSAVLVLSKAIVNPTALMFVNILTIVSAFTAVLIPIILFGIAPALAKKRH